MGVGAAGPGGTGPGGAGVGAWHVVRAPLASVPPGCRGGSGSGGGTCRRVGTMVPWERR